MKSTLRFIKQVSLKIRLTQTILSFCVLSLVATTNLNAQETITFDDQGFTSCEILNSNHSFSAIGKTFNIFAGNFDGTTSSLGSLWFETDSGGCWHTFPTEFEDGGYITAAYADGQASQQWYHPEALIIKTIDGSDFKFTSFKAHDAEWNSWGNYLKISGYKDGSLLGAESVTIISDVEPYHSTVTLTDPVFESIDEVRITMDKDNNPDFEDPGTPHSDAEGLFHSFDTFVVDNATISVTIPTVTTTAETGVGSTNATLGGEVTDDGGDTVSESGIVWGTSSTPDIDNDNVVSMSSGVDSFSQAVELLPFGTTIYYRAYATNGEGTAYGSEESFTTGSTVSVSLDGAEGWRLLAIPDDVALSTFLDPIWTQGVTTGGDTGEGIPNVYTWSTAIAGSDQADWQAVTDLSGTTPDAGHGFLVQVYADDDYNDGTANDFPQTRA